MESKPSFSSPSTEDPNMGIVLIPSELIKEDSELVGEGKLGKQDVFRRLYDPTSDLYLRFLKQDDEDRKGEEEEEDEDDESVSKFLIFSMLEIVWNCLSFILFKLGAGEAADFDEEDEDGDESKVLTQRCAIPFNSS